MLLTCAGTSGVRRWFTLATGLVECLCFSGVVFGWASLVFVLKTEGYFSLLCVNTTHVNGTQTMDCSGQDDQFSLVFATAVFVDNALTLPVGFLFDRYGTAVARLFGILLYTLGTLLLAFSSSALSNMLFPALTFIALGGTLLLITNMQVGNLFGSRRSTIITLYNGAFDSSSAVFLVIKLLVESGVSLRDCLLFVSACGVIHTARTFLLMPTSRIPYPLPDSYTYGVSCGKSINAELEAARGQIGLQGDDATAATPVEQESPPKKVSLAPERSFRECVLSRFFLWHLLWLSVMQLRHYLFIVTLNPMLQRLTMGEPSLVSQYLDAFAFTQLFGLLCAPWNGLIIDRRKGKPKAAGESECEADLKATVLSLCLTPLQCVLFSLCATIPILPLQYLTFILQVLNRSFLYGGNAAFISIAFPQCHFGKLFGLVMALAAVFGLLQYPCVLLVNRALGGDPLYVNAVLTLLSLLTFIHPLSVYLHCRDTRHKANVSKLQ